MASVEGVGLDDDLRGELGQALAGRADGGRRDRDRGDHGPARARARARRSSRGPPSSSSHVVAKPTRRTWSSSASSSPMSVIVFGPEPGEPAERRLRGAEGHEHLAHRRGVDRDPAPDPVAGAERVAAVDLGDAGDAARRRDRDVRRLARRLARAARETARRAWRGRRRSCRAVRTRRAPGPGRKPPPRRRCASPFRSSARSRRAAVDFGSCVSSITPASVTTSSLSTRRTRMRARAVDRLGSVLDFRHGTA